MRVKNSHKKLSRFDLGRKLKPWTYSNNIDIHHKNTNCEETLWVTSTSHWHGNWKEDVGSSHLGWWLCAINPYVTWNRAFCSPGTRQHLLTPFCSMSNASLKSFWWQHQHLPVAAKLCLNDSSQLCTCTWPHLPWRQFIGHWESYCSGPEVLWSNWVRCH